jgi:hypothetical protein
MRKFNPNDGLVVSVTTARGDPIDDEGVKRCAILKAAVDAGISPEDLMMAILMDADIAAAVDKEMSE